MSRYSDFSEMEATPEISSALDIYSEETVSPDDKGRILHIYSENRRIHEILENLFYDILNVEFNLVMWVRNLCKYGDFFLFNDVSPEYGVINAYPIAISEIEREENFDPNNPSAVRFRWLTQGNTILENWQVSHFRLLGNDAFLPYGTSVLESARRIWRQLILIEDAMLVYRVIRAPERRVFYIDVGNVPPEDVAGYLEQAQSSLKRSQVIDKDNGKVDLRYNPLSVDEDYFLPVRGGESGTKIDTLAGGQNTAAIEDVEYIQKKLFAALKIPRAYLGYDEEIGSKATLAQEDIRFSRSIQRIQKTVIAELNKLAMIHLFCHGYEGDDLIDFDLKLSNPSSVAQQQKLELIRARFEIAGTAPEGLVSRDWIRKNVMGLTDNDIKQIEKEKEEDKIRDTELEAAATGGDADAGGADAGGGDDAGGLFAADIPTGQLLTAEPPTDREGSDDDPSDDEEDDEIISLSIDDEDAPAKAQQQIRNAFNEPIKKRRVTHAGADRLHTPDFLSMTSVGKPARNQDSLNMPHERDWLKNPFKEGSMLDPTWDDLSSVSDGSRHAKFTVEMESVINSLRGAINIKDNKGLLSEDAEDKLGELESDGKSS
tara:strand:- start:977 stop:2776 length:1800 start_codon:yes stop_codon:yes gene_type:complete